MVCGYQDVRVLGWWVKMEEKDGEGMMENGGKRRGGVDGKMGEEEERKGVSCHNSRNGSFESIGERTDSQDPFTYK